MLDLWFSDESVWRDCCDAVHMRRRWGTEVSRVISRRLQQLEAMTTIDELDFLPFDSRTLGDAAFEVDVTADIVLAIEAPKNRRREDGPINATIIVTSVRARSDEGRP
jgi:hypothetical protein